MEDDAFLQQYTPSELKIASEFLSNWLPFLSRDLCKDCVQVLSDRIRTLDLVDEEGKSGLESEGRASNNVDDEYDKKSTRDQIVFGSFSEVVDSVLPSQPAVTESSSPRISWADMAQEDDFEEEEEEEERESSRKDVCLSPKTPGKVKLSRDQRENLRLMHVKRKKDFISLERVKGKLVNVVDGLELHTGVFSAVEQKRIVDLVYELEEKGRKGELKGRTFTAPRKWMRGKGRVTIQFGCCYNYAPDGAGNLPGILQHEEVDPLPSLFKVIIRRLIKWHVLPPTCVPDSCIVNIYNEGDCIPPHIDNHEFLRPFCTISFLSECNILFGSNLKTEGPGEFSGPHSIPLPVGSVLVLNGNGADIAKHCVPAVPTKRISITFRKMDESKRPVWFTPEPDLQGIKPMPLELNRSGSTTRSSGLNNSKGIQPPPFELNRSGSGTRSSGLNNSKGILPVPLEPNQSNSSTARSSGLNNTKGIEPLSVELNRSGSSSTRSSGSSYGYSTNRRGYGRRGGGNYYNRRGYYNNERSNEERYEYRERSSSSQGRGQPSPPSTRNYS